MSNHSLTLEHPILEAAHWLAEADRPADKPILLGEHAEAFVVTPATIHGMMTMGELGQLPLAAIALPQHLTRNTCVVVDEPVTLDLSNTLTTYFSSYLTAALYELQALCKHVDIQAYIIGGQVRDILLHQDRRFDVVDVDITVEANAIDAAQRMVANSRNFTVVECFPEFGTATLAYKDDIRFDMASTRQEHYAHCGALPEVTDRGVPLHVDIGRRDFTVNTLAMSVDRLGQVWDYAGGMEDLEEKLIRVLHPLSFYEDPSRILRAYKFASRLNFNLCPTTEYLIHQFMVYGGACYTGGGDRIRSEAVEFLSRRVTAHQSRWVGHFQQLGGPRLFNMALPSGQFPSQWVTPVSEATEEDNTTDSPPPEANPLMAAVDDLDDAIVQLLTKAETRKNDEKISADELFRQFRFLVALWPMLSPLVTTENDLTEQDSPYRQTLKRLEITRQERDILYRGLQISRDDRLISLTEASSPIQVYQLCQGQPMASLILASLLAFADDKPALILRLYMLHRYVTRLKPIKPKLNGDDLIELGIPFGEAIGQTLEAILFQKLLGRLPTRDDEITYVQSVCLPQQESSSL